MTNLRPHLQALAACRPERPILIAAGGTGGHVFPGLSVASVLRDLGLQVIWIGTQAGLESRLVPEAGIEIDWIMVKGLRGKGKLALLAAPWHLFRACFQAIKIVLHRKPQAVLGMGGFVSGPAGFAAWLLRKPLIVHEQNAVPGLTNKLLSRLAKQTLEAFPGTFKRNKKIHHIGNPVRSEIAAIDPPEKRLEGRVGPIRLLIIGGSQGAQVLNQMLPETLSTLSENFDVWHQAGDRNIAQTKQTYADANVSARVEPFIAEMADAYSWADLVICRSGAMTVTELAAAGVAAILIPYPLAVDDHQSKNGQHLVNAGGAIILQQKNMTKKSLGSILKDLSKDRSQLITMACCARTLSRPDAAKQVAAICLEVGK